jgi:hypothetical protein
MDLVSGLTQKKLGFSNWYKFNLLAIWVSSRDTPEQKVGLSIEINPTVRALQRYKGFLARIKGANLGITLKATDFLAAKSENHHF